jgi:hypothetical protein
LPVRYTVSAAKLSPTVPSDVQVTVTVKLVPEVAETLGTQPPAVPLMLKSPAASSSTAELKIKEKVFERLFERVALAAKVVTAGFAK